MKKITLAIVCFLISTTMFSQAWTQLSSGTTNHLQGVSAPSASVCYAAGYYGIILKTSDGGTTWVSQTSGSSQNLASIQFTDINTGYAVGDNGAALKTTDGGISWTQMPLGTSDQLRNVRFLDANTGYITGGVSGSYGSIFKTSNAGLTWTNLSISAPNIIYSSFFTSALVGYASEYSGLLFKTINGGMTWNPVSTGVPNIQSMVVFPDSTNGILVTFNGSIQRTTNAGASWSGITSGTTDILMGVDFHDAANGFTVGGNLASNNATILSTNNGGVSWAPVLLNSGIPRLCRIDFVDHNTGYIVGLDGTILKYADTISNPLMISITTTNVSTSGSCDGSAIAFVTGGAPPYTYLWSDSSNQSGSTAINLCAGIYSISVTDANGISANGTLTINNPTTSNIVVTAFSINASSYGICDGSATANVASNGYGYSYLWNTGQTTSSISGLCAGTYVITVTDSSGASGNATVVINQPNDSLYVDSTFVLSVTSHNVSVLGSCDGNASVMPIGGTPPYVYSWSNGDSTTSVFGLCSNVYYITVNDANGQSISSVVYISEPNDTITNTTTSTPIDTLNIPPIDTCIIDFNSNIPIDSAFIASYTVIDSSHILVHWLIYHNGLITPFTSSVQYSNIGINLLYLTLNCSGVFRELHTTTIEDAIFIDYGLIGTGPVATGINNNVLSKGIIPLTYPNPVKDNLNVEFVLTEKNIVTIKLLNSLGQETYLLNQPCEKGENKIKINTENLNSGIYIVQITVNNLTSFSKIVK